MTLHHDQPFPKPSIPVQFGVGSPSQIYLYSIWRLLLILLVLPKFTLIFRANLGQRLFARFKQQKAQQRYSTKFPNQNHIENSLREGFLAALRQYIQGGVVSTTTGLIQQAKRELQKLREQYLRNAADPAEAKKIELRIRRQKELLAELGAEENG